MNYKKLKTNLDEVLTCANEVRFDAILKNIHCMSRPKVYAVLNAVVSCMDAGELYVEVGTYQGGSLISALLGNQSRAIGVDSFSEFQTTNNFDQTQDNLLVFGVADRVELKNMSFEQFFAEAPKDMRIQVYYYDGAHDYQTQLAGMEAAWSRLSAGSLILVDDYTYPEVSQAINQFVANHIEHIKFKFVFLPDISLDDSWWNGCVVMQVV